jgi:hypothetical protein
MEFAYRLPTANVNVKPIFRRGVILSDHKTGIGRSRRITSVTIFGKLAHIKNVFLLPQFPGIVVLQLAENGLQTKLRAIREDTVIAPRTTIITLVTVLVGLVGNSL